MNQNIQFKTLFTEHQIQERVAQMAEEIASDYSDNTLMVVGLLNGSFVFLADLVRQLSKRHLSLTVDFMRISSYGSNTVTSGKPTLNQDFSFDVKDRHVLIVDDILDTGHTIEFVMKYLNAFHPLDIRSCVCLDKPERRQVDIGADYVGFIVPDVFVVGYGLDYNGRFREMSSIAIIS